MRSLQNKTNVLPPDADYPYGRIKNNPGDNSGTPVNENTYGDFHQFFEKLMAEAGVTPNELPDNEYSGWQLFESLIKNIRATAASEADRGTAELATQSETNTGTDDLRIVTPHKLKTTLLNSENWTNIDSYTKYRKDAFGYVHLFGVIGSGRGANDSVLPVGYRPGSTQTFYTHGVDVAGGSPTNANAYPVTIDSGGVINAGFVTGAGTDRIQYITGISFKIDV